jgi:hypothetical protein
MAGLSVRFCKTCEYSKEVNDVLFCGNYHIIKDSDYCLAANDILQGSICVEERSKTSIFAKCGKKGKLWKPRGE